MTMHIDHGWDLEIAQLDCMPPAIRDRAQQRQDRRTRVNAQAHALFEEQGWQRVWAWADRTVNADERLRLLVGLGWLIGGPNGVFSSLNEYALQRAADGDHETAVSVRLMAISCQHGGIPGSPDEHRLVTQVEDALAGLQVPVPSEVEWRAANVDAMLKDAQLTVDFSPPEGDA